MIRKTIGEKGLCFHALYDRIFRLDILWQAWKEVRANKGSAGIDGITFEMIEEYGVEEYLLDIQEDLQNKAYRPKPVKRVYIPKPDGKQRSLGIPTIRDRIVQQACKIVIEPIFEANFLDNSCCVHCDQAGAEQPDFSHPARCETPAVKLLRLLAPAESNLHAVGRHGAKNPGRSTR